MPADGQSRHRSRPPARKGCLCLRTSLIPSPCTLPLPLCSGHHLEDARAIAAASGAAALVCLPLLAADTAGCSCDAAAPHCLGALTLGFPAASAITGPALKGGLLLAHALVAEQGEALQELSELVCTMLLPPRPSPRGVGGAAAGDDGGWDSDSDGWGSDLDFVGGWDDSASDDEHMPCEQPRRRHAPAPAAAPRTDEWAPPRHSPLLLTFASASLERAFAQYHSVHMQIVDRSAYALCFLFFL